MLKTLQKKCFQKWSLPSPKKFPHYHKAIVRYRQKNWICRKVEVTHGFQVINIRRSLSISRGDTRGKVAHVACRDNDIRKQRDSAPVRFMLVRWARWSRRIYKHVYAQWHYSSVSRITKDEPIPRFIGLFAYMLQGCEHIKWQPMNPGQPIFRSKPIRLVAFAYIFLLFSFSFFLFFLSTRREKELPFSLSRQLDVIHFY